MHGRRPAASSSARRSGGRLRQVPGRRPRRPPHGAHPPTCEAPCGYSSKGRYARALSRRFRRPRTAPCGRSGRTVLPGSSGVRALVPVQPEPAQIADDRVGVLGSGTVGIDVLHAQHERTAFAPAGQPREQKSPMRCRGAGNRWGSARACPDGTGGAHPCFRETMKKTERTVRQQAVTMTPSTCSPASSQPRNTPMTGLTYS